MNFKVLLGSVFGFFVMVLIVCYFIARDSNPVFLDEHGKVTSQAKGTY